MTVLLMTACGSKASSAEEHEALQGAIAEVKADTGATVFTSGLLKIGITSAQEEFTELGDALDTSLASLSTDIATMKSGATALQTAATALQADTTALRSDVTALRAQLSAAHRYSETCDPSTDPRLRSAWPGLSDAEFTDACLRDGRWHALGTLLDFVMGTLTLPDGMEVGLTSYSRSIAPVTVNGWEQGTRFCLPPSLWAT